MIMETPGPVSDRIILLGRRESCVYLINGGTEYALLGGGMLTMVPDMIEQLESMKIREDKIRRMVILHSHFDHCGAVPFLKKRWPWAVVTASARASDLLSRPKVTGAIEFMNQAALEKYAMAEKAEQLGLFFSEIQVENAVQDGDRIQCGDVHMDIIGVPGHSSCSIAVYLPEQKAMFASDAAGVPFGNEVLTAASSDFDQYRQSLSKIAGHDMDALLLEHFGARTGQDARRFLDKSMQSADETRTLLEASLRQTGDVAESTARVTRRLMEKAPDGELPEEIVSMVVGMMLNSLSRKMSGKKGT